MKSPAGYEKPRRRAAARKEVRLDLRPTQRPPTLEEEIERSQKSNFWKWFGLVVLFHLVAIVLLTLWAYRSHSTPPPESFISLMPEGDTVKGTAGAQAAPKVGASTPAAAHHHHASKPKTPTPPQPAAVLPPTAAT